MSKWIKASKGKWGLSSSLVFFDKVNFYTGWSDHWGLGCNVNFYDRSFTIEILNMYLGVEIWHKE